MAKLYFQQPLIHSLLSSDPSEIITGPTRLTGGVHINNTPLTVETDCSHWTQQVSWAARWNGKDGLGMV